MKLLLVDDSRTMRNVIKRSLEAIGPAEFAEAGDGAEALGVIAGSPGPFDLMLVDWNMPNMDGITFVRKVREQDKTTPIMMVTTEAEKGRVIEAIKAGVNNYAVKPFTAETLVERVTQTLSKAKAAA